MRACKSLQSPNLDISYCKVFTGVIPFSSCRSDPAVMYKVRNGERPPRPAEATKFGLTDDLWDLVQSAWAQEPEHRPPVESIIGFLLVS